MVEDGGCNNLHQLYWKVIYIWWSLERKREVRQRFSLQFGRDMFYIQDGKVREKSRQDVGAKGKTALVSVMHVCVLGWWGGGVDLLQNKLAILLNSMWHWVVMTKVFWSIEEDSLSVGEIFDSRLSLESDETEQQVQVLVWGYNSILKWVRTKDTV